MGGDVLDVLTQPSMPRYMGSRQSRLLNSVEIEDAPKLHIVIGQTMLVSPGSTPVAVSHCEVWPLASSFRTVLSGVKQVRYKILTLTTITLNAAGRYSGPYTIIVFIIMT